MFLFKDSRKYKTILFFAYLHLFTFHDLESYVKTWHLFKYNSINVLKHLILNSSQFFFIEKGVIGEEYIMLIWGPIWAIWVLSVLEPANTTNWNNVGLTLAHGLRRWPNIKPTLLSCVVFARGGGCVKGSLDTNHRAQIVDK